MRNGIEINFLDLCRYYLKKWPILLAITLTTGLLANVYGWRQAAVSSEMERESVVEYASALGDYAADIPDQLAAELAELRSALTEQEASFTEAVAKLYMYRMWASEKINAELIVGEPDGGDLEIVQTLYYANEGVQSGTNIMTSAEKAYYNVLVRGLSGTDMSPVSKDISNPGFIQSKWLVIGCVLGLLLGCVILALIYLLSGTLRVASDMEEPFGVSVLARIQKTDHTEWESLAKGLERLLGERKKLAVCCADSPEAEKCCADLAESLSGRGLQVKTVSRERFVGDTAESDAVLFVEQIGKSRYTDIEKHVSDCRRFGIPTAGCIVVE